MSWAVIRREPGAGRSPWRIVDASGNEVPWLNDFLDTVCLRAVSPLTLRQ
jgi:hypothetical protein